MPAESESDAQLEIGHVLFMDIVGYSRLLLHEQREAQDELNQVVRKTEAFRAAEATHKLVRLPVGDGMALVFFNTPEAPVQCAIEIAGELGRNHPTLKLRMGIHSGPINQVKDVNDRVNIAGAGINVAQRVMDCGDAGHILLSKRAAEDLAQARQWRPHLHDLGECSVKHSVNLALVNLYTDQAGNPAIPGRIKQARAERATVQSAGRSQLFRTRRLWPALGLVLIAALVTAFFLHRTKGETSIAVLPFENFSDEKENAFFADGIQDDILTSLARIEGLRVISRTSVMGFRGPKESLNLREISRILGVTNVVEGSVRREGNRVVVNVQLIDAQHDRHLWANRYDRTLDDSLGLQGELAGEIADALRVRLTPEEKERVARKPTANAEAYVVYLRANQIERNPDTLLEDYKKAEQLYLQAITLDPGFALAHARLASTCAQIFHYYEPLESWKTLARAEADTALRLQENLAEAHLASGQCMYWINGDYDGALREFDLAARLSPNNTEVGGLIAGIKRRQGHWQESLEAYQRIHALDPQNPNIARNLVFTCTALRRWPEASRAAESMCAIAPASLVAKIQRGYIDFWWKGDTQLLKSLVVQVPAGKDPDGVVTAVRWDTAMLDRDFASAKRALEQSVVSEVSYTNGAPTPKSFLEGCIYLAQNDTTTARKYFEEAQPAFENALREAPNSAERHANLGWLYAFMGRKDDAIREGRRAVELKPESADAVDGAIMNCYLALIYARVGERDEAFRLLERLVKTPGAVDSADYSITVSDLKYRWEWDPLRDDPRFQKLIASD